MSDIPTIFHHLRVQNHVAHRAVPPTRWFPWSDRTDLMFLGWKAVDPLGRVSYAYLVPDLTARVPTVNLHVGVTGDPSIDPIIARGEVNWNGPESSAETPQTPA